MPTDFLWFFPQTITALANQPWKWTQKHQWSFWRYFLHLDILGHPMQAARAPVPHRRRGFLITAQHSACIEAVNRHENCRHDSSNLCLNFDEYFAVSNVPHYTVPVHYWMSFFPFPWPCSKACTSHSCSLLNVQIIRICSICQSHVRQTCKRAQLTNLIDQKAALSKVRFVVGHIQTPREVSRPEQIALNDKASSQQSRSPTHLSPLLGSFIVSTKRMVHVCRWQKPACKLTNWYTWENWNKIINLICVFKGRGPGTWKASNCSAAVSADEQFPCNKQRRETHLQLRTRSRSGSRIFFQGSDPGGLAKLFVQKYMYLLRDTSGCNIHDLGSGGLD